MRASSRFFRGAYINRVCCNRNDQLLTRFTLLLLSRYEVYYCRCRFRCRRMRVCAYHLPGALCVSTDSARLYTKSLVTVVNGVSQGNHNCMRLPSYDGPIMDVTSSSMSCNGSPNTLDTVSPNVCPVPAGSQVTLRWGHTLTSSSSGAYAWNKPGCVLLSTRSRRHRREPQGPPHGLHGQGQQRSDLCPAQYVPQDFQAAVNTCIDPRLAASGWFKIYEAGLSGGKWAVDTLIANGGKLTVTIPSCIPAGDYLLRGELIALHAASSYPGAQLVRACLLGFYEMLRPVGVVVHGVRSNPCYGWRLQVARDGVHPRRIQRQRPWHVS
jgi:hypothetical protein